MDNQYVWAGAMMGGSVSLEVYKEHLLLPVHYMRGHGPPLIWPLYCRVRQVSQDAMIEFPCNQSMICTKVTITEVLDLRVISRFDLEQLSNAHTPRELKSQGYGRASNLSLSNIDIE